MIASLQLAGAIVIHVPSRLFAEACFRMSRWYQKDSHTVTSRRVPSVGIKTTYSQQIDLLSAFPGIGEDKAKALLEEFGDLWGTLSAVPEWGKIPGIGPRTVGKIMRFMDYTKRRV